MIWVARLAGLALVLQTLELWQARACLRSVWNWGLLREDYPRFLRGPLGLCLDFPGFDALLLARLLAAGALVFVHPAALVAFLLLTTVLIAMRFRGACNGGSDTMTVVVLTALLWPAGGQVYLAVQAVLSYFVAGVVKLRQPAWRDGSALSHFLGRPLPRTLSWLVVAWECSFPLALLDHRLALVYCATGVVFHLANCRLLGLNRFLWIWLATYPAVCSGGAG